MVWQTGEIKRADSIKLPVQETRRQWMACNPGRGSHWLRKIWIQPRRSSKPLVSTGSWCRGKPSVRRWRGRSGGAGPRGGEQYTPTPWWLITSETAKSEAIGRSEARRWRNGTVCVEDKRERRSSQEGEWGKSRANGLPSTPSPIDRVGRVSKPRPVHYVSRSWHLTQKLDYPVHYRFRSSRSEARGNCTKIKFLWRFFRWCKVLMAISSILIQKSLQGMTIIANLNFG